MCYTYAYTVKIFGNEEEEKKMLTSKWLNINEDVAHKRTINCNNVADLRNI
jgi:uncharacterized protein affecting Mg2+/Co2+ transport